MKTGEGFKSADLNSRGGRWLLFLMILIVGAALLLLLEPPVSTLLLGALALLAALGVGIRQWRRGIDLSTILARTDTLILALLTVALMLSAASLLHPDTAIRLVPYAAIPLLAGMITLGVALHRSGLAIGWHRYKAGLPPVNPYTDSATGSAPLSDQTATRARWIPLLVGVGLLAVVAEISGDVLGLNGVEYVFLHAQIGLFVVGVALVGWGMAGKPSAQAQSLSLTQKSRLKATMERPARRLDSPSPFTGRGLGGGVKPNILRRIDPAIWLILAVTVIGWLARLILLERGLHLFLDEINFAHSARVIQKSLGPIHLLRPFHFQVAFPWTFSYGLYLGTLAFGNTLFGIRFFSTIVGALGIPAVAWLGYNLFGKRVAVIAAVLLATFPPHIHFSRLALNNIADPLLGTLALGFFAAGLRTGSRRDYALAGMFLGLTQYFHEGGRILYPALLIAWVVGLVVLRRRDLGVRVNPHHLIVLLITALIVAAPVYYTIFNIGGEFATRMNLVGLQGDYWVNLSQQPVGSIEFNDHLWRIAKAFLVYVNQVDRSYFFIYYGGTQAMVLAPLVPLLLIGLATCVWRVRQPGASLLLLWLFATSFGNTLMIESAAYTRYVIAFPALALLLALGLDTILRLFNGDSTARVWRMVLAALLVIIGAGQTTYYFTTQLPALNQQLIDGWRQPVTDDAVLRAVDFPPNTQIHFINEPKEDLGAMLAAMHFFNDRVHVEVASPDDVNAAYFADQFTHVDHAYFFDPDDSETLALLNDYYELDAVETSPFGVPPEKAMLLYYVPAEADGS